VRVGNGCNVIPWTCVWKRVELLLFGCSWSLCSATALYFLKVVPLQPNPSGMYITHALSSIVKVAVVLLAAVRGSVRFYLL
jgi:hypothetical protein